jgi:hypothetical protein
VAPETKNTTAKFGHKSLMSMLGKKASCQCCDKISANVLAYIHDVKFLPVFGLIWQIWQLWKSLGAKSYKCMTNSFLIFD